MLHDGGRRVVVRGRTPWRGRHLVQPAHQRLLHLGEGKFGDIADFTPPPMIGIRPHAWDLLLDRRGDV
eukprot:14307549-Alexandrium_andersonii.AAC.1